MEERDQFTRKRKRPSPRSNPDEHHSHHASHHNGSGTRHKELHHHAMRFSTHSHQIPRVRPTGHARRQELSVNIEASMSLGAPSRELSYAVPVTTVSAYQEPTPTTQPSSALQPSSTSEYEPAPRLYSSQAPAPSNTVLPSNPSSASPTSASGSVSIPDIISPEPPSRSIPSDSPQDPSSNSTPSSNSGQGSMSLNELTSTSQQIVAPATTPPPASPSGNGSFPTAASRMSGDQSSSASLPVTVVPLPLSINTRLESALVSVANGQSTLSVAQPSSAPSGLPAYNGTQSATITSVASVVSISGGVTSLGLPPASESVSQSSSVPSTASISALDSITALSASPTALVSSTMTESAFGGLASSAASGTDTPNTFGPTITSSGIALVPVATSAIRFQVPFVSDGSTIGSSFTTSFSTRYSTVQPSASDGVHSSDAPAASRTSGERDGLATSTAAGLGNGGSATPSSAANSTSDDDGSVPTPTVVGSVVGGVAGLTAILLIALLFLKWYKRRRDRAALSDIDEGEASRPATASTAAGPGAAAAGGAAAGAATTVGGVGLLKRLSRRIGPPPAQTPPPPMTETGQGGFQRISGRKLPSRFSPGMEGPGPSQAPSASYPSGSTNYPSGGTYASTAMTPENPFADPGSASPSTATFAGAGAAGAGAAGASGIAGARYEPASHSEQQGMLPLRPGPGRTPTVHQGEGSNRFSVQTPLSSPPQPQSAGFQTPQRGATRTPSPAIGTHPALRPGTASSLSPTQASRGRGGARGPVGLGRGMTPPPRGSSGSRFLEEDM